MHPERPPEPLEARLRALPPPPVPAGLEARLLAAVPAEQPAPRRRWPVWVALAGAAAAACLLAVLAWTGRDTRNPVPRPDKGESANQVAPRPPDDPGGLAAWHLARRNLDEAELPPFTWPLPEPSPVTANSIPPDLLD
jgi:hypothetical protein